MKEPLSGALEHPMIITRYLRAEMLEIFDKDSRRRISLFTDSDNLPAISMFDDDDKERLTIGLEKDNQVWMAIRDQETKVRLSVSNHEGYVGMFLNDEANNLRAVLYITDECPALNFYDANEVLRFSMFLEPDGRPYLTCYNDKEQSQAKITVPTNGSNGLIFEDEDGNEYRLSHDITEKKS